MSTHSIRELMVPLSNYATVTQEASLFEAVLALKEAQAAFTERTYKHRAILIFDENNEVVGKVNLASVLKALEPKYGDMLSDDSPSHAGFSTEFQREMIESFKLWDSSLKDLCAKAAKLKVKSFMMTLKKEEQVEVNAPLEVAIHQLVLGQLQSLIVMENESVVGLLRLTDVYESVAETVMACEQ